MNPCVARIIAETRTSLDPDAVAEIVEEMIRRSDRPRARSTALTPLQEQLRTELQQAGPSALTEARDAMFNRARRIAAQERLNVIVNAEKAARRRQIYEGAPNRALGIESQLVGVNAPFKGSRDSAEANIAGNKAALLGAFQRDLEANNLDDLFRDNHLEREWARELAELNRRGLDGQPNGNPGVTGNRQALQIAEAIQRLQQRGLDMVNREGAFVGQYSGYVARTSHTPELISRMGEANFEALARRTWDLPTMYPNRSEQFITASIRQHYNQMSTGVFGEFADGVEPFSARTTNVVRRVSESRSIHFRDADAWLAYTAQASEQRPAQIIIASAMKAARDAGLMRIWGTNPKAALAADIEATIRDAQTIGGEEGAARVQAMQSNNDRFDLYMSILDGSANRIHNRTAAAVVQNVMTIQRLAKLGFLPFAQLSDLANISAEMRYQGMSAARAYMGAFGSYFNHGINSEKQQVARLVGSAIDGWLGDLRLHLDNADPQLTGGFTGALANMQSAFFRYSGAQMLTERARAGGVHLMATHFGGFKNTPFHALEREEARIMRAFNVTEAEWDALRTADWVVGADGHTMLTPDAAMRISDSAIDGYIATQPVQIGREDARQQIASRLYSYFADRQDYAVLNLGVAERAFMTAGKAADTPLGAALRLFWQFKSFMLAQVRRTWGREINGRPGEGLGKAFGLIEFAAFSTVAGITANGLTQLVKGQNPLSQWENDPGAAMASGLTRGGAGSIIGDFLFSEFNRHGKGLAEYAAGPSFGVASDALVIFNQLKRGENPAGSIIQLAKSNAPFQNLWWSKWATDYMIWNSLQEYASPGYLRRVERNLSDNQGIEFLKYPVDMSPANRRAF